MRTSFVFDPQLELFCRFGTAVIQNFVTVGGNDKKEAMPVSAPKDFFRNKSFTMSDDSMDFIEKPE